jgi:hypothetical protein
MKKDYKTERRWHFHYGNNVYPCVVIGTNMGHRCGYVAIGTNHPLYKRDYNDICNSLFYLQSDMDNWQIGDRGVMPLFISAMTEEEQERFRPDLIFDVHGSITYSNSSTTYPVKHLPYPLWWFGYDCGHHGDGKDFSLISEDRRKYWKETYAGFGSAFNYPTRTLKYCIEHCHKLAVQLDNVAKMKPLYEGVDDVIKFTRQVHN